VCIDKARGVHTRPEVYEGAPPVTARLLARNRTTPQTEALAQGETHASQ